MVVAVKSHGGDLSSINAHLDALYTSASQTYDWCLVLDVKELGPIAGASILYDAAKYDKDGMQKVAVHLERVQRAMLESPVAVAANVNLLTSDERAFVLNKLNDFDLALPPVRGWGGSMEGSCVGVTAVLVSRLCGSGCWRRNCIANWAAMRKVKAYQPPECRPFYCSRCAVGAFARMVGTGERAKA